MTRVLRLRVFGTAGIECGNRQITGPATQGQALALLAILACGAGRGVPREKLFALLWPDAAAERASHRLSQLAHWVRRGLGSPDLIVGSGELRLTPERIDCDIWEFAEARRAGRLERAAEVYAGPFLDGFYLADAGEFERWTESRRSALAREYQETLEALAVQAELRGDPQGSAGWWRRLAEHEPLSSRVTMHLMTALAAAGDRARALERASAYQRQVRSELEAEPNPAVLALARLLRGEAAVRPVTFGVLPLAAPGGGPEAQGLAEGLTEELTSAAAELPGLRVASGTSLAAARRATQDVRQIGARLGLAAVLEGSVRLAAGRVRVAVRLVDVADGCHCWSGRYERVLDAGFETQVALARGVVEAIRPQLVRLAGPGSVTPDTPDGPAGTSP